MTDDQSPTIEDYYHEERTFPPSPEFVAAAVENDPLLYERAEAYGIDYIVPSDGDIFAWRNVEPEEGRFDWFRADAVLGRLRKHGLAV